MTSALIPSASGSNLLPDKFYFVLINPLPEPCARILHLRHRRLGHRLHAPPALSDTAQDASQLPHHGQPRRR